MVITLTDLIAQRGRIKAKLTRQETFFEGVDHTNIDEAIIREIETFRKIRTNFEEYSEIHD